MVPRAVSTLDRPLFVAHASDDVEGQLFLTQVFHLPGSAWRPVFYPVEGPQVPHANSILKHISKADGLVVLLSQVLAKRPWTRSWVGFEVGAAAQRNLPILVVEPLSGFVDFPVPGVTHYARRPAKATALRETFWARVARTDFLPVEDEPLEPAEGFWDRAGAFFYNLGLKTRSVEGSFTRFRCSNSSCRASYFVEDGLLHSTFQCPSCRHETATPMIELQNDLMKLADEAAKARQSRE